jgi:alpha-beta hydrolase superfamily lysophospholipase
LLARAPPTSRHDDVTFFDDHCCEGENTMPQGSTSANEGKLQSAGGLSIFYRAWRPDGKPRAVVVIVPGFNSHSGYYEWVAGQFGADGLAVYAVDLRGRGKSDGERFYVQQFADYLSDTTTCSTISTRRS